MEMKILFLVISLLVAGLANATNNNCNSHCQAIRKSQEQSAANYRNRFKKVSQSRDCTKTIKRNCDNGRESIA